MTMNGHETFEELISASLSDDLTDAERQRLDDHLDGCAACRGTLAAFADQRLIMAGLRHVAPPRDLAARVRTGIERGQFAAVPWWRRPVTIFAGIGGTLAAVAGALLAMFVLNGSPADPQVGESSPTPSVTVTDPTPIPTGTLPVIPSATPDASPIGTPVPPPPSASSAESPVPTPSLEPPVPDVVMAASGPVENFALSAHDLTDGDEETPIEAAPVDDSEVAKAPSGPPIAAELSADGQWLAFVTEIGERGVNDVWATRLSEAPESDDPEASPPIDSPVAVGETVHLGESVAGGPFLERLSWSRDGRYLAYTLADPETEDADADAWMFDASEGAVRRLTEVGNAYAASWSPETGDDGTETPALWISTAGDEPVSWLHDVARSTEPIDPATDALAEAAGVFQPLLSPDGSMAIVWGGQMTADADRSWIFAADGAPYLAAYDRSAEDGPFVDASPLFADLPAEGELFTSASITWGPDGDAYAVWDATWTGDDAGAEDGPYPDATRVYFGHASDDRRLTRDHAIDSGDIDPAMSVVDVELAPTGGHLLITVREARGGVLDAPRAELLLVTRHTGSEPDEVATVDSSDDGWVGPALFLPREQPDPDSVAP